MEMTFVVYSDNHNALSIQQMLNKTAENEKAVKQHPKQSHVVEIESTIISENDPESMPVVAAGEIESESEYKSGERIV